MNYAASKDRAEETVKSLKGDGHVLVQGDVFSRAGVEAVAKEAKEKLGGVDIVISNAGWTKIAPWSDIREYLKANRHIFLFLPSGGGRQLASPSRS